jgi:hypothetical protein
LYLNWGIKKLYCAGHFTVWCGWLLLTIIIFHQSTSHALPDDSPPHWTRLNYGVAAIKMKTVCIVDDYWIHTIHIPLPEIPSFDITSPNATTTSCDQACQRLQGIVDATRTLVTTTQGSITDMIQRIHTLVPDIAPVRQPRRRSSRGLFDFIGSASSWLFGLATESSTEELRKHIEDVLLLAKTAADDSARVKDTMVAFTRLANERFETLHAVLNEQQKSHIAMANDIQSLTKDTQLEFNAIIAVTLELARYVQVHDNIQQLEFGVEALIHGQISPRLIDVSNINSAIANATEALRRKSMSLCTLTAKDVYTSQTFDFARHENDLFVRIRLPYTRFAPMVVYKTFVFPIPVPGLQGLTTMLRDFPRWFVHSDSMIGELTELPIMPSIDLHDVIFHNSFRSSCLFAIVNDDTQAVHDFCDFTARKAFIAPSYIRLNVTTYIISNLTRPRSVCKTTRRRRPLSIAPCAPCLITLPCGCSVSSGEAKFTGPSDCTSTARSASVYHGVNLIILQHFYDMNNFTLTGNTLFSPARLNSPTSLHIPLFSDQTSRLLAADESVSYSLNKLTSSLQNDSVVLHSSSDAILYDYLHRLADKQNRFPNFTEAQTWLILLPLPCLLTLFIFYFILYRRFRVLQGVLTLQALLPKTNAFVLRPTSTSLPLPTSPSFMEQWMASVRDHDFVFIVFLIIAFLAIIGLTFGIYRALSHRTYLYLDFNSADSILQLYYFTFPDASRCYTVKMPTEPTLIIFRTYFFFGVLSFKSRPWLLHNTATDRKIPLPSIILIPFWHIKPLQHIMATSCYNIYPLVVHSHEYNYYQPSLTHSPSPPRSVSDIEDVI